jgi:hypothetical protein
LVLLAKVLQNLANETRPGERQDFMLRLDEFVVNNIQPLHQYYDKLAVSSLPLLY